MHPCHSFLCRKGARNWSRNRLPVSMMYIFFAINVNYAIDDIDGGTHEVIRLFGFRYFLNILNERTSFALRLHAFESSSWSIVCIDLLAIELPMLCSASLEIILKLFKVFKNGWFNKWLRCWNVRVNGIQSVFSFCDIYLNARNRIAKNWHIVSDMLKKPDVISQSFSWT